MAGSDVVDLHPNAPKGNHEACVVGRPALVMGPKLRGADVGTDHEWVVALLHGSFCSKGSVSPDDIINAWYVFGSDSGLSA